MKRIALASIAVISLGAMLLGPALAAAADGPYYVAWTRIGIFPRSTPELRSDNKAGPAVPDGTRVTIICESTGQTVTSDVTTSDIWEWTTIGWIPNAFVETGANGFTPGIPLCTGSAGPAPVDPVDPPAEDPPVAPEGGASSSAESPRPVDGVPLESGAVVDQLFLHYLRGSGKTVVLDFRFYAASWNFMNFAKGLDVGEEDLFQANILFERDVYLASGNFWVTRVSDHCWTTRDDYDFDNKKPSDILFEPIRQLKFLTMGANFRANSSGCVF